MRLYDGYPRLSTPETGRQMLQLTSGPAFCYPLYYYTPSITADGRFLIYHRAEEGWVQLYRLELATGESVQLTHASTPALSYPSTVAATNSPTRSGSFPNVRNPVTGLSISK